MTLQVFKYPINPSDEFNLKLPKGARILHFGFQQNGPMIWALVDPSAPPEVRRFRFAGTGHLIEGESFEFDHIGTTIIEDGQLVFHLFERRSL